MWQGVSQKTNGDRFLKAAQFFQSLLPLPSPLSPPPLLLLPLLLLCCCHCCYYDRMLDSTKLSYVRVGCCFTRQIWWPFFPDILLLLLLPPLLFILSCSSFFYSRRTAVRFLRACHGPALVGRPVHGPGWPIFFSCKGPRLGPAYQIGLWSVKAWPRPSTFQKT